MVQSEYGEELKCVFERAPFNGVVSVLRQQQNWPSLIHRGDVSRTSNPLCSIVSENFRPMYNNGHVARVLNYLRNVRIDTLN